MTGDITVKTSAADALTDWQQAVRKVEAAGRLHADQQTRKTKLALKQAQAEAEKLLKNYYIARMMTYAAQCERQTPQQ
jgi:hypothetical protein